MHCAITATTWQKKICLYPLKTSTPITQIPTRRSFFGYPTRIYFDRISRRRVESRYYWNQLAKTLEQQAHSERRIRLLSLLLLSAVLSSTRKISCSRKPLSVV